MSDSIRSWFMGLSPLQRLLSLLGLAGVAGAAGTAASASSGRLALILTVCAAIALGLVVLWNYVSRKDDKKLFGALKNWGRRQPGAAGGGEDVVKMQAKFQEGLVELRDAAKRNRTDMYHIPWYLIVGPSGAGKTELIRRSGVNFLVEKASQGEGGTQEMDWWPSEGGIIVDSAGRLFTEGGNEWVEMLKLLRTARPRCPVNGVLLVIGADRLLENEDKFVRDLSITATRFAEIQRYLSVRLPVYVVVTKCDLIPGFKEFFEHISDPTLQQQLLGWSDPVALEEEKRFKPSDLATLLQGMVAAIRKRRMSLLMSVEERPGVRRVDAMDNLYEFPDVLERKVMPRLQRALETAVGQTQGYFASKPAFIRGLYFTSAMQRGSAIDRLVSGKESPEGEESGGRSWALNRAVFIRDLLEKKVFPEHGLVTPAANVGREVRMRRLIQFGSPALVVVVLGALMFAAFRDLRSAVRDPGAEWAKVAQAMGATDASADAGPKLDIVGTDGERLDEGAIEAVALADKGAERSLRLSFPFSLFDWNKEQVLGNERARARRMVVEYGVLERLTTRAISSLRQDGSWEFAEGPEAGATQKQNLRNNVKALAQLLQAHRDAQRPVPSPPGTQTTVSGQASGDKAQLPELSVLAAAAGVKGDQGQLDQLQSILDTAFADARPARLAGGAEEGALIWPPDSARLAGKGDALKQAVEAWGKAWQVRLDSVAFAKLDKVRSDAEAFEKQEKQAWETLRERANGVKTSAQFEQFRGEWAAQLEALQREAGDLERSAGEVGVKGVAAQRPMLELLDSLEASLQQEAQALRVGTEELREVVDARVRGVLGSTVPGSPMAGTPGDRSFAARNSQVLDWTSPGGMVGRWFAGQDKPRYLAVVEAYKFVGEKILEPAGKGMDVTSWSEGVSRAQRFASELRTLTDGSAIDQRGAAGSAGTTAPDGAAEKLVDLVKRLAGQRRMAEALRLYMPRASENRDPFGDRVSEAAQGRTPIVLNTQIPFVGFGREVGDARFHPDLASQIQGDWLKYSESLDSALNNKETLDVEEMQRSQQFLGQSWNEYSNSFDESWSRIARSLREPSVSNKSLNELFESVTAQNYIGVRDSIALAWNRVRSANAVIALSKHGDIPIPTSDQVDQWNKSLQRGWVESWLSLSNKQEPAKVLLDKSAEHLGEFEVFMAESGATYWSAIVARATEIVINEARNRNTTDARNLFGKARVFPIARDANDAGTSAIYKDEIDQLNQQVRDFNARIKIGENIRKDGLYSRIREFDQSQEWSTWSVKIENHLRTLRNPSWYIKLGINGASLPEDIQNSAAFIAIQRNGEQNGFNNTAIDISLPDAFQISPSDSKVVLQLWRNTQRGAADQVVAECVLEKPWPGLRQVLAASAAGSGDHMTATFQFVRRNGATFDQPLRVRLQGAQVSLEEMINSWPALKDWPK